jgi:bifunctional non-homologous end joining protein LigD
MTLHDYRRKRDFKKTPEPTSGKAGREAGGGRGDRGDRGDRRRFVIQKHAASRLHYDFRLEIDGVLKSWAVPKGVPYQKGERRLAVQVEDHPVSYIDFEGTIPKGQYGGGTVMVWDYGTFETPSVNPAEELEGGKLHVTLHGKKLKGEWYLVRLKEANQWLLIRGGENMRPVSKKTDDTSARSGKSMAEIAGVEAEKTGEARKTKPPPAPKRSRRVLAEKQVQPHATARAAVTTEAPAFIKPMKALLVAKPPPGEWVFETKFDGYRAIAIKNGAEALLLSRNEKDFARKFPEVLASVSRLDADDAILDGEVVAIDENGLSSFQSLQAHELNHKRTPIYYLVFDLLRLNGEDLRGLPLSERKKKLDVLLRKPPGVIRVSPILGEDADPLLKAARKAGAEGLIGKRKDSVYESDRRSGKWIKLKLHHEQEFVIGGYTDPSGSRGHFGALLVGYHEGGKLKFAGKVGTGFDESLLANLHMKFEKIAGAHCPFDGALSQKNGGNGLSPAELRHCHWLSPRMVCQVRFSEWTRDGKLRHPVFLGIREDKNAGEVTREKEAQR